MRLDLLKRLGAVFGLYVDLNRELKKEENDFDEDGGSFERGAAFEALRQQEGRYVSRNIFNLFLTDFNRERKELNYQRAVEYALTDVALVD